MNIVKVLIRPNSKGGKQMMVGIPATIYRDLPEVSHMTVELVYAPGMTGPSTPAILYTPVIINGTKES
jgi:hypothetical protein